MSFGGRGGSHNEAVVTPVLELVHLAKSYVGTRALDGVSLAVQPGEIHAIVGENGAGKSTLIRLATGAIPPDAGQVVVDGVDVTGWSRRAIQALGIRAIYQERQIAGHLSVAENVLLDQLPRTRAGLIDWRAANRLATERLDRVGLDVDPSTTGRRLSVAQMQLVEIARAVSYDARLIVMDEPTASLHRDEVQALFAVVRSLRASGVAVLYISHHLDEVFEICDRVTVLRDGQLVGTADMSALDMPQVVTMIFGRVIEDERPALSVPSSEPPIVVADDLRTGGGLRGVSLTVRPGEIVAVTGGIGSGTSALADALAGAVRLQSGQVAIGGMAVHSRRSAARTVAFLPSDRKRRGLLLERSVAENIALGQLATGRRWFLRPGKVRSRAVRVSEAAGIKTSSVDVAVRTLSGGNQQKVVLGRWLDAGSRVLVVDEPTAGIDIAAKFEIYGLLRSLASQGAAVIVCTTDFQEVPQVADRVLVMRDGRIVGACGVDEATEHHLIELEMAG